MSTLTETFEVATITLDHNNKVTELNNLAENLLGNRLGQCWELINDSFNYPEYGSYLILNNRKYKVFKESCSNKILLLDITDLLEEQKQIDQIYMFSKLRKQFAILAHQLKTPLATAMLMLEAINNKSLYKHLDLIRRLINSLLIYVQEQNVKLEDVSYAQFARELEMFVHNNYNNKIEIEFTLSEHVLAINTEMLLTAISNVIDNAIYVSEDTKPKLTMFVDQELTISVADSGDGIPAHKIETIFEPTVSSKVGGLGIGMHVLHKIVAKQDGRVTINKLNKGTMVNIILPLKRDDRI